MNVMEINVLVLAFLGDAVYEEIVRRHLIEQGIGNVNDLQKRTIDYVSAPNQAKYLKELLEKDMLLDEEKAVVLRARNSKTTSHPKSCDIITYKYATGLEALIGYLDYLGKRERIHEIMNFILGE